MRLLKRVLCIMLCIIILCCGFCLTAYADTADIIEFITSFLVDSVSAYKDVAADPDALLDYYNTPEGVVSLYGLCNVLTDGVHPYNDLAYRYVSSKLDDATERRYMVAELDKSQVEKMYNALNDYWFEDSAEIRSIGLGDTNLTYSNLTTIHGAFGYTGITGGSGVAVEVNSSGEYMYFNSGDIVHDTPNTIWVYNGSPYYPPIIFFAEDGLVSQAGTPLDRGYYYVLSGTELLSVGGWNCLEGNMSVYCQVRDSHVVEFGTWRSRWQPSYVWSNGQCLTYGDDDDDDLSYKDVYNKFVSSIGLHLATDDKLDSCLITPPADIPYDDDDKTVMMLPIDEPGEPVYMSPTVYNNYVTNGDIYNTDDHSNNVVSGDTVTNITNNYNNYITNNNGSSDGGYDDTNLLGKLDVIINKLDQIYNAVKNIDLIDYDRIDQIVNPPPSYDNFGDITAQVPLIGEVRQLITDFQAVLITPAATVPKIDFELFGVTESIKFDWYKPYQGKIKSLLKAFAYLCGVISCWLSLKSAFGVTRGGEE